MPADIAQADQAVRFPVPYSMAFQPIVAADGQSLFAYEALVRGEHGEGAMTVLRHLTPDNRYAFDRDSRAVAICLAAWLGLAREEQTALLSVNFLPNAVGDPAVSIRSALRAAEAVGLPPGRILFEFTEHEAIDPGHLQAILRAYRVTGFRTAIDDFGAGYSGLGLLSRFQPDVVKLDMALIRCIDIDRVKRTIVSHLVRMAGDLGVAVVAEGVETVEEYQALLDLGVGLFQGYLFAKPGFESLPEPSWPKTATRRAA
jgi:EAL domain-containing protein (putative c-di-GMP-specific phosphodiesterase class I)